MQICELFLSLQGESTLSGKLCTFVRLSGCNLRCGYCDSVFSYEENGDEMTVDEVIAKIKEHQSKFVCITGGEPLLQKDTPLLCEKLLENNYLVSVETNGSLDISVLPKKVRRIVDVKTPGSGMSSKNLFDNLQKLHSWDEVKFVVSSKNDYTYSREIIEKYDLLNKCEVLISPAVGMINAKIVAQWIIEDKLNVRLNLQLHKTLWGNERGK